MTACFEHCALKPMGESVCFDMFEDDAGVTDRHIGASA
jgi:hypothetical protein